MALSDNHALAMAIAKACGIPTGNLKELSFHDSANGVAQIHTTHYAYDTTLDENVVLDVVWTPTITDWQPLQ